MMMDALYIVGMDFEGNGTVVAISGDETPDLCDGCGKAIPWNEGCADDMPHHCDACWCAAHHPVQVADATPISSDITCL